MEKLISKIMMFVVLGAMACSCSSDDDSVNYGTSIAGSYASYSEASFTYGSMVSNNETITITAGEDNESAVLTYSGTWGSGSTSGLTILKVGSTYTLSGEGSLSVSGHSGTTSSYDFTVTGSVSADLSTATFTLTIEMGNMGTVTVVTNLGYAPAEIFVPGTYTVDTSVSFFAGAYNYTYDEEKVTIAADGDVLSLSYSSDTWGTTSISDISVELSDAGVYTLTGSGVVTMTSHSTGTASNYDCTLSGTISSDKEDVELTVSVPSVMSGTTFTFTTAD